MCQEEWKSIERLPGYRISSLGRLMKPNGSIQLGSINAQGYRQFYISRPHDKDVVIHAHKEVCIAFYGPKPFDDAQVRHKNGDKEDNSKSNVCWGSHEDNMNDRDLHGTTASGERQGLTGLTQEQVREIRSLQNVVSRTELCARFKIARATLQSILSGKTWRKQ